MKKLLMLCFCVGVVCATQLTVVAQIKYKLLATSKTSTMQKELNQLADGDSTDADIFIAGYARKAVATGGNTGSHG